MKRKFLLYSLLATLAIPLFGCNAETNEVIENKDESTIIKDAKSVDPYLEKEDYKSIAYAYIYHIKESLNSYESETNGTVKAKVLFFDYNIDYTSVTYKNGSAFYSKDKSVSTFATIDNEFYQVDRDKILVSREKDKYDVYAAEDYKKVSYLSNQYTIMGYVFNDQSILKSELINDKNDEVSIQYTLDNELATNLVKIDFKNNGDLSEYPNFKKVNVTLSMKKDFTPISYKIDAVYDASRAFIGTTEVRQDSTCLFSSVNEKVIIPNESFLKEKLGAKASELILDDAEKEIKNDLLKSVSNLDIKNGVSADGALTLNLGSSVSMTMDIAIDAFADISALKEGKIYDDFGLHATFNADEYFSSLMSIVQMIAGESFGPISSVIEDFRSLEVIYDGDGSLYFIPANAEQEITRIEKVKLTDMVDLILKNADVSTLISLIQSGQQRDMFTYTKKEGTLKGDYTVELELTEDSKADIKAKLDELFEDSTYSIIKSLISYEDFDNIKFTFTVKGDKLSKIDGSVTYLKDVLLSRNDALLTLAEIHLDITEKAYDHQADLEDANALYETYLQAMSIKEELEALFAKPHASRGYIYDLLEAYGRYLTLSEQGKIFAGKNMQERLENAIAKSGNACSFLDKFREIDITEVDNEVILEIAKIYYARPLDSDLLRKEMSEEEYTLVTDLGSHIDYDILDVVIPKINGDDETAWGLTEQEIKDVKVIVDLGEYISSVDSTIMLKLLLNSQTMDSATFKAKINSLYDNLA